MQKVWIGQLPNAGGDNISKCTEAAPAELPKMVTYMFIKKISYNP